MLYRLLLSAALPLAAAATLLAVSPASASVLAAKSDTYTRPDTPGALADPEWPYHTYTTPATAFSSREAVVHYVTTGLDAPPLNDDNSNAVPDYVEQAGAAADLALATYRKLGFLPIAPDSAGPDSKVDIYIERFLNPQLYGITVPGSEGEGGSFVAVSPRLDQGASGFTYASLRETVAHELFHVVQFAYFPYPGMPSWATEGTAVALGFEVFPESVDFLRLGFTRSWLSSPVLSLVDSDSDYDGWLFWSYLLHHYPTAVPGYFAELAKWDASDYFTGFPQFSRALALASGRPAGAVLADFGISLLVRYPGVVQFRDEITPVRGIGPTLAERMALSFTDVEPSIKHHRWTFTVRSKASGRYKRQALPYLRLLVGDLDKNPRPYLPRLSKRGTAATFTFSATADQSSFVTLVFANPTGANVPYVVSALKPVG